MRHEPLLSEEAGSPVPLGRGRGTRCERRLRPAPPRLDCSSARADWDVSLVQRQVDLMPSLRLERLAAQGKRLVLDVDDAIWHDRSPAGRRPSAGPAQGHSAGRFAGWLNAPRRSSPATSCSRSGSALLQRRRRDPVARRSSGSSPTRVHERRDRIVLGWLGSRSTARSLTALADPLTRTADLLRMPTELLVVGGPAPDVAGIDVRQQAWCEESERDFLRRLTSG